MIFNKIEITDTCITYVVDETKEVFMEVKKNFYCYEKFAVQMASEYVLTVATKEIVDEYMRTVYSDNTDTNTAKLHVIHGDNKWCILVMNMDGSMIWSRTLIN